MKPLWQIGKPTSTTVEIYNVRANQSMTMTTDKFKKTFGLESLHKKEKPMKYLEFKKAVEGLSKHYSVYRNCGSTAVDYRGRTILEVPAAQFYVQTMATFENEYVACFRESLPYSHKLWMLASEFSMTPVKERKEHQWNVVIGQVQGSINCYCAYAKSKLFEGKFWLDGTVEQDHGLEDERCVFSDSEFDDLIAWLKKLPDGDRMAKIAELGKVPAQEAAK